MNFLDLPHEIHAAVFAHLNWPAARNLRQSCRRFRTVFSVRDTALLVPAYKRELLRNDTCIFPSPCYTCLQVKSADCFDTLHIQFLGGPASLRRLTRRCVSCSLVRDSLVLGTSYRWRHKEYVFCSRCRKHRSPKPRWGASIPSLCGECALRQRLDDAVRSFFRRWRKEIAETCLSLAEAAFAVAVLTGRREFDRPEVLVGTIYVSFPMSKDL